MCVKGISDGAGALILASEEAAKNLKPLARLVGWSYVGVDPSIMGIGPVPAIENLLKVTKLTLNDIDLIEVSLRRFYMNTEKKPNLIVATIKYHAHSSHCQRSQSFNTDEPSTRLNTYVCST